MQLTHNDVFHEWTKYIETDFICQHILSGMVHLLYIASQEQPADILTKTHPPGHFLNLIHKLKMASTISS